ncbi:hypothetical protein NBH00_09575 [Paraconexibacter antarcticus]|uniref:Uncharacterized protein n=1 Tax=Paraconexibacter antarcticus TaxID=2949664 RepID=A0ABY5DWQ4_9ACTN|nr:hypothetical protein [Paraconexibacter antarcticus]UTI66441.1 hypothetical protein NBH00_09575 [Paraconexibacter antarcticus]
MEPLEGIAAADALLGRPFPLPAEPLPLPRWVEVRAVDGGAEVEWNLDDSRAQAPGRLALFAGPLPPPDQLGPGAERTTTEAGWTIARAPLAEAQPSLRPVVQVTWAAEGLHLRLTGQGPWELAALLRVARSVR